MSAQDAAPAEPAALTPVFQQLCARLDAAGARYRVVRHPAAGTSESVAKVRGTEVGQGAKAMLCRVGGKGGKGGHAGAFVLGVLPGDQRLDFKKLGAALGGGKASLVSAEHAQALTGCVIGAIPPFAPSPEVALILDPQLTERYAEIAFNAGSLEASIVLDAADYLRIAQPRVVEIVAG
jgi:Ala-tRNA(Pro) deacylase